MNEQNSIFYKPAFELRRLIAERSISCTYLTEQFLQRIQKLNPELHAYLFIDTQGALDYAQRVDMELAEGKEPHSLTGVPSIIPDVLHMIGTYTTFGSKVFEEFKDADDSIEVDLLKKSGSVILGKGNIAEFGLSYDTINYKGEMSKNPWNLAFSPGGGGGGTATAVAAGLAALAIATDFNGSLRVSASYCGLHGLMPTRGRVPIVRKHLLPFTERMFYRKGVIARNTRDMAMLLNVLAKPDERDPNSCCEQHSDYEKCLEHHPQKLRIAYTPDFDFIPVDPEVRLAMESGIEQLKALGHHVEEARVPIDRDVLAHFLHLFTADRYLMVMKYIDEHPEVYPLLGNKTKEWLKLGHEVSGVQYSLGISYMGELTEALDDFLQTYDMILTPTSPVPSFPLGSPPSQVNGKDIHPYLGLWGFLIPCNITGHPTLVVPCDQSKQNVPIGMQLIGRQFSEGHLLSLSYQLEKRRGEVIPPFIG